MLLRIFRIIARRVASCRVLVVMLLALQVLYLLPVLGSSYLDGWQEVERIEVDNVRSYASSDALDDQAYSVDNAVTAWLGEGGRKKAAAADRMIERYDAGDAHGYFEAAADHYRVTAEVQGYAGSQSLIDRAEAYQALADSGASDLYMVPDHMPASLYAVFGHKLLLALPGAQLPLIYTAQGDGMMTYNGQCELLFWMVPLVAVCGLGASLQTRGRLATQAPCTHRRRLLLGTLASASIALTALVVVCAPALVAQMLRVGVGDLSYPVLFGSGPALVVSSVGEVLARNIVLMVLVSLVVSLAMHLSALLFDSVLPSVVLLVCMMALPLFPGYFGEFSRYRDIAPYLPSSYLWTEYAAGSLGCGAIPSPRPLAGVTFGRGCLVLGATVAGAGALLALLAPLGALVSWGDRGPRRRGGLPTRRPGGAHARGHGGAHARPRHAAASVEAPASSWLSDFAGYSAALAHMLLAGPGLYALALIMASALVLPAVFSVDPDTSEFSHARYEGNQLKSLYGALSSGVYEKGSAEAGALERLADALSGYVYSATLQEGYESLAEYERLRLEVAGLGPAGPPAALQIPEVDPVSDPVVVEGKIALLEGMASLDAPEVYGLSTLMPGSYYLSFIFGVAPFAFWLVPAVASALGIARLRCKGALVQQAPVSSGVELAAGVVVAGAIAIVMLACVIVPGTAYATMRHGIGDWGQPVVFVQGGEVVRATVLSSLLSGAGMEMLASGFVVAFLACVERLTQSFRSVCVAAVLALAASALAVQASLLAPADGVAALVLGWLPLTYLDVARVVGAAGYTIAAACGASRLIGAAVLAASIAFLLVFACIAPRVSAAIAARGARVRDRSCVIRI